MRLGDLDALKKALEPIAKQMNDSLYGDGIYRAIKEIDNAPTVEPEKVLVANVTFDEDKLKEIVQREVIDKIKNGELVIQEEKPQVEWIGHIQYCKQHNLIPTGYKLFVWCNRCNCPNEKRTKFCPNCGARMVKSENN